MTRTWRDGPVTVRVPATSANLGPGFDSLGLALTLHDEVTARATAAGLEIEVSGPGAQTAEMGERHLVVRAMRAAFDVMGGQPEGIAISCRNAIPHGFGLGSSAAAIVAGLLAARALAGDGGTAALPDIGVLGLAAELEGHPDNVAACLSGGLTIAWQSTPGPRAPGADPPGARPPGAGRYRVAPPAVGVASSRVVEMARLEPLAGLMPVVCAPDLPLATEVARRALPALIPHADAAANSARAALLVAALTSRPDLLLAGTEDFLHQRYRAESMPATAALTGRLRAAGIAAAVSGAGPAVLAFPADDAAIAAVAGLAAGWRVLRLRIDTAGARLIAG